MLGAVFEREVQAVPRARGSYVARAVYCGMLLGIVATCWLVVTGTQAVTTAGDTARFGATLLRVLAPLQLALAMLAAAMTSTVAVTAEKDRRTLELLLISRLTDAQLVLGKLAGSLLRVLLLLVAAVPVFVIASLFGGVTLPQLARVFAVTSAAAVVTASVAACVAFWKDTTFQSLAITTFAIVAWVAAGEVVAGRFGPAAGAAVSPARAVLTALEPGDRGTVGGFAAVAAGIIALANLVAVTRVRAWNTVQERRRSRVSTDESPAVALRRPSRQVWNNPVLWREICTRAHGRAMLLVRVAWLLLFGVAVAGIVAESRQPRPDGFSIAVSVMPMALASLLAVAAMAVTSITTERDRGALDVLLVTDLEPSEFVWGKLLGILAAAREIVILPLVLCGALAVVRLASVENAVYLGLGMTMLVFFAAVLGLYAGLSHAVSRGAIAVALGTVAFLFVGVATAMRIMVAFGSSFELQLAPFLAVIVGGAVGLYAALSARNPSPAIGWASALLPALTFVAITGFLQGNSLQVFLVAATAYGFATLAMLVPAIGAFDLLTGRTTTGE